MTVVQLDEKRGIRKLSQKIDRKSADIIQLAPTTKIKKKPTTGRLSAQLVIKGGIDYREEFDWFEPFKAKIIAWQAGLLPNTMVIPLYAPDGEDALADEWLDSLKLTQVDIVHYEDFPEMISEEVEPHFISRYYAFVAEVESDD